MYLLLSFRCEVNDWESSNAEFKMSLPWNSWSSFHKLGSFSWWSLNLVISFVWSCATLWSFISAHNILSLFIFISFYILWSQNLVWDSINELTFITGMSFLTKKILEKFLQMILAFTSLSKTVIYILYDFF